MLTRPFLIGLITGLRSITPIAAVSQAARDGQLQRGNGALPVLRQPLVSAGLTTLAAGELAGDKMRTAPNRTVPAGMLARVITAAVAGQALADRRDRVRASAVAVGAAVLSSHLGLALRLAAIRRYGQVRTGVAEDLLTLGLTAMVMRAEARDARRAIRAD